MSGAIRQEILVRIRTLIDGLNNVKEYASAIKSVGNKKLGVDTDKPAAGAFKLVTVLRQLSPALDQNITRAESLGSAAGASGAAMTGAAVGAGVLLAALAAVVALLSKAVNSFVDYGSHIRDLQEETGAAAGTLTTLDAGAQLAGKSVDDLIPGIDVFLRKLSEVARGNETTGKTFLQYGITQKVAKEAVKDTDGAVRLLLDTLSKYPNAAERLEASNDLAGKSGKALARVVEEMGGDFRKFEEAARAWGVVLSEQDVQAADKFGDAVTVMGFKVRGILFEIARGALPELQKSIDDTTDRLDGNQGSWEEWGREAGGAVREIIQFVRELDAELKPVNDFLDQYSIFGSSFRKPRGGPPSDPLGPGARFGGMVNSPDQLPPASPSGNRRGLRLSNEPTGGGGKGGGKSLAEKLRDLMADVRKSEDAITAAERDVNTADLADQLDREKLLITQALEGRLVSYQEYYAALARIETSALDNEIIRQQEALFKIDEELKRKRREIAGDKKLKPGERVLKETDAANEATAKATPILQRINELERERAGVTARIAADAKQTLERYQGQLSALQNELLRATGQGVEAAKHEIDADLREMRERAIAEGDTVAQAIINAVRSKRVREAQGNDIEQRLRDKLQELRVAQDAIDAEAATGNISQEEAERRKLDIARLMRGELESVYGELKGIADVSKDPALQEAVARLGIEIAQIGVEVDRLAQDINRDLKQALEDTLFAIVRRQQSLKEAVTSLVNHILDELARLASSAIIDKLFGENGIFGGIFNSKGGQGGIGGILSGIFGPRNTGGNPQAPKGNVSILDTLPGVIKNFQSGTTTHLQGIKGNTFDTVSELRGGFGGVQSKVGEIISFLPNLLPAQQSVWAALLQKGIEVAGALAQAKVAKAGQPKQPHAFGGLIQGPGTDTSDSIPALLSNNEFVIRAASVRSIGPRVLDYINRMGELPHFNLGGIVGELPSLDLNAAGGVTIEQHFHNTYQVEGGGRLSRLSEAALQRDIARATLRGTNRSIASRKW